jgi:hypothetical protein
MGIMTMMIIIFHYFSSSVILHVRIWYVTRTQTCVSLIHDNKKIQPINTFEARGCRGGLRAPPSLIPSIPVDVHPPGRSNPGL